MNASRGGREAAGGPLGAGRDGRGGGENAGGAGGDTGGAAGSGGASRPSDPAIADQLLVGRAAGRGLAADLPRWPGGEDGRGAPG